MAVRPVVKILASDFSHLAFLTVWRDSGVTRKHGFELRASKSLGWVCSQLVARSS